jgi:hypothetical protein
VGVTVLGSVSRCRGGVKQIQARATPTRSAKPCGWRDGEVVYSKADDVLTPEEHAGLLRMLRKAGRRRGKPRGRPKGNCEGE